MDDRELLHEYAARGSESAFAEIVQRHVHLVYSAARRQVADDHQAADITQRVFILLAQKARWICRHPVVVAWLFQTTRLVASESRRAEARRQQREQAAMNLSESTSPVEVWESVRPHLDDAIGRLKEPDRQAVLLRFFQNKSYREIGTALAISDDSAQKRVSRALERLRILLQSDGTEVSSAILAACLAGQAVKAAPTGLAVAVAAKTMLSLSSLSATTATMETFKLIMMTQCKTAIAAGLLTTAAMGTAWYQVQQNHQLRQGNTQLTQEMAQRESQSAQTLHQLEEQRAANERLKKDHADLFKLRAKVARLQEDLAAAQKASGRLKDSANAEPLVPEETLTEEMIENQKQLAITKMHNLKSIAVALHRYASKNNDHWPQNLDAAQPYLRPDEEGSIGSAELAGIELLFHGAAGDLNGKSYGDILMAREKEPWKTIQGKFAKAYAFMDGHSEIVARDTPEEFIEWEQQRLPAAHPAAK